MIEMMKHTLLFLFILMVFKSNLASDPEVLESRFGRLIDEPAAFANAIFGVSTLFSSDLPKETRELIVEKTPKITLSPEEINGSSQTFIDACKDQIVVQSICQATVYKEDLKRRVYRQSFKRKAGFKLVKTEDDGSSKNRVYWKDKDRRILYDLADGVEESGVGYDPDLLRAAVNEFITPISAIIQSSETKKFEEKKDQKYTGRSRHILTNCPEGLVFHNVCIKKWIDQEGRCPGACRVAATKKDVKFKPNYKKDENCTICLEPIKQVTAVEKPVSAKANGGAGGPTKRFKS